MAARCETEAFSVICAVRTARVAHSSVVRTLAPQARGQSPEIASFLLSSIPPHNQIAQPSLYILRTLAILKHKPIMHHLPTVVRTEAVNLLWQLLAR